MKLEQCYIEQIVGITVNGDKYIGEVVEIKVDNAMVNILPYLKMITMWMKC